MPDQKERHVLSVLVENEPGVLSRVVGLFSGRGYNIHSLNVAPALEEGTSHMTITTFGDEPILEQITKQLHKLVPVIKVSEFKDVPSVEREMMSVKVQAEGAMRAPEEDLEQARREGVHIHNSCTMSGVRMDGDRVSGVDDFDVQECRFDEQGRLSLIPVPGGEHSLACDTVIFAVGMKTELDYLGENAGGIDLTPRRWIRVDGNQRTSKAGSFAAGDVSAGPASIAGAVGDGRRAAFAAHEYLTGTKSRVYALDEENRIEACDAMGSDTAPEVVQYADIYGIAQYEEVPMEREAVNSCEKAFAEQSLGLTAEQAQKEAARCCLCGHC